MRPLNPIKSDHSRCGSQILHLFYLIYQISDTLISDELKWWMSETIHAASSFTAMYLQLSSNKTLQPEISQTMKVEKRK